MRIKYIFLFFLLIVAISCVGPKYSIVGLYSYKDHPRTTLELRTDGRFDFIDLASVEFPELDSLRVITTSGRWIKDSQQIVFLNSINSSKQKLSDITKRTTNNLEYSRFTFLDVNGDTIQVNYQLKEDGTVITGVGKYQFSYWIAELESNDTLVINCSEYGLWTYVKQDNLHYDFDVILYPEYIPNYFNNYPLKIRRGRLYNIELDAYLEKSKSL